MGVVRGSVSIAPPDLSERRSARANKLAMIFTGMRHFRHSLNPEGKFWFPSRTPHRIFATGLVAYDVGRVSEVPP